MADEQDKVGGAGSPTTETKPADKPDADVSKWIKNLGALVTIFAAIGGIGLSLYQLRLKAQADAAAAYDNRAAEQSKRDLGIAQLKDQAEARESQAKSHDKDVAAELQRHELDIQQAKDIAADTERRNNAERLSKLIEHLFSSESNESDISSLFEYINLDEASTDIIENAVLARLEKPKSKEEVDLGFRLLERIGPSAMDVTVQANRSARAKYDDCLLEDFYERVIQRMKPQDAKGQLIPSNVVADIAYEVASSTVLDRTYVFATINKYFHVEQPGVLRLPAEGRSGECTQPMITYVISRSTLALLSQIQQSARRPRNPKAPDLDLSNTYLTGRILVHGGELHLCCNPQFDGAYLGLDNLAEVPFDLAELIPFEGADLSLRRITDEHTLVNGGPLSTNFTSVGLQLH